MIEGLRISKVTMTPSAALRVLETALDAGYTHGIGYWADVVKVLQTTLVGAPDEERVGAICIVDREGEGEPDLTILGANNALIPGGGQGKGGRMWVNGETVHRAVERMLSDPQGTESAAWSTALMTQDVEDGPLADAIIQVACFGKVIYG